MIKIPKAHLLTWDGEKKEVKPENGTDFSLEEMQELVGGDIEIVRTVDDRLMVLDEEGKIKGRQRNEQATVLYDGEDEIVGNVLVADKELIK